MACAAFGGLGKMWREKSISIGIKMKLLRAGGAGESGS